MAGFKSHIKDSIALIIQFITATAFQALVEA